MHASKPARIAFLPGEPFIIVRFPRYDAWAVDQLKRIVPSESRSYDPSAKAWLVHTAWLMPVRELLEDAFGSVIEEGWDEPAAPTPIRRDDEHFAVLYLTPNAPAAVIEAVYRTLARIHHPDKGGDSRAMQQINDAYAALSRKRGVA